MPLDVTAAKAEIDKLAARHDEQQRQLLASNAALAADLTAARARIAALEAQVRQPLWGSSVWAYPGETQAQALARTEKAIGPVQIVRHFSPGAPTWPTWSGTRVLHTSHKLNPAEVAAGRHDATIRAWAAKAPTDRPTYATLWHEVDKKVDIDKAFSLADFLAAWKRWAGIIRASGKPIKLTLTLTGWILRPEENGGRTWQRFYPGDEYVDVIAWDPYAQDRLARVTELYDRAADASASVGKPWAVAETGASSEFLDATQRPKMLTGMARYLASMPNRPLYVCYFDPPVGGNSQGWPITQDPAASAAWVAGRTA